MSKGRPKYIRYADSLLRALKKARVPGYFSRYSNRVYSNHQHCALIVLRQLEAKSYRSFVDWLEVSDSLLTFLKLKRIPHYTTLQKFTGKVRTSLLHQILESFIHQTRVRSLFLGVDSTGFSPHRISRYYSSVLRRNGLSDERAIRRHLKLTSGVELTNQIIVSCKISTGPGADFPHLKQVAEKAAQNKPLSIVVADKGYDSENNHETIRELGAESIIPARNYETKGYKTRGRNRRRMKKGYDKKKYHQRSKTETVFYVIKQLMGDSLNSHTTTMQHKELILKQTAYNTYRINKISFQIKVGFLHGQSRETFK